MKPVAFGVTEAHSVAVKPAWRNLAVWVVVFALAAAVSASHASPWLRFDEEAVKALRTELVRIEAETSSGKLPADTGRALISELGRRIQELEAELPERRQWFASGQVDAQRDISRGVVRYYSMDESLFRASGTLICSFGPPQATWNSALARLTGASIVSVQPTKSVWAESNSWQRDRELSLLAARVEGYNTEVWRHLRAQHGADIEQRVEMEAGRTDRSMAVGPLVLLLIALGGTWLMGRLVAVRKRRERLAPAIGAT